MGLLFQQRSELAPAPSYTKRALDTCKMRFLFNRCHIIFKTKRKRQPKALIFSFLCSPLQINAVCVLFVVGKSVNLKCLLKMRPVRVWVCVYRTCSQIHKVLSLHFLCYIYWRGSHSGRRSVERDLLQIRTARMSNVIWNTNIINNRVWDDCVMKTHPQTNGDYNRLKAKREKIVVFFL